MAKKKKAARKYKDSNVHNQPHKTEPKNKQQQNVKPTPPVKEPVVTQQEPVKQPAVDTTKVVVQEQPKPERHEFVQRTRNKNDLPAGTYVIVGAFRSEANSKKYSGELVEMEYGDAHYGFISARNLWYVYLASSPDVNEARKLRDEFRQEHNFKDAWILTVE